MVEVFLLNLFVTGVVVLTCLYFGYITRTAVQSKPGWEQYRFILFFFVEILDYSLIAVLIAMLIKRAGLALGVFFLYMIIEQFVVSLFRNKYKQDWGRLFTPGSFRPSDPSTVCPQNSCARQ
ncbi:MAG: hypothetical protein WDM78_23480 [Puia sp.]